MTRNRVALLRGINVDGANKLPMADLRDLATGLGWSDVTTYVASGNLVFCAAGSLDDLTRALGEAVKARMGKPVPVIVLTADAWRKAVEACPYSPTEDKLVHLQVHAAPLPAQVREQVETLVAQADDGTEITVDGRWIYLHTPHGLSRSVAFTKLARVVPGDDPGTARNLRTARALVDLLDG